MMKRLKGSNIENPYHDEFIILSNARESIRPPITFKFVKRDTRDKR